jgi:hypothetical protein
MGHVLPGTPPLFTMQDSDLLLMVGASLELHNSGPLRIRTKTRAQHVAATSLGSRGSSSLKCVAVSTLQYHTSHSPAGTKCPTSPVLIPVSGSSGLRHFSVCALVCQTPDQESYSSPA